MGLCGLAKAKPCDDGKVYLHQCRNLQAAWNDCTRPDWMKWYLYRSIVTKERYYAMHRASIAARDAFAGTLEDVNNNDIRMCRVIRALYPVPPKLKAKYR